LKNSVKFKPLNVKVKVESAFMQLKAKQDYDEVKEILLDYGLDHG